MPVDYSRTRCPIAGLGLPAGWVAPIIKINILYTQDGLTVGSSLSCFSWSQLPLGIIFSGLAQSCYPEYCSSHISLEGWLR
jgi:hypothetical protein